MVSKMFNLFFRFKWVGEEKFLRNGIFLSPEIKIVVLTANAAFTSLLFVSFSFSWLNHYF